MRQSDRQLTTSRYNPTFEEWEDTELADLSGVLAWAAREHPGELVAAVKTLANAGEHRFCLYHFSTARTDPEVDYCRAADFSGYRDTAKIRCKIVTALIVTRSKEGE